MWADPAVPGFHVPTYATLTGPFRMTFDPSGILYAGNANNSLSGARIRRRIGPGGSRWLTMAPHSTTRTRLFRCRRGRSTTYEWLVVAGAGAQYKGTGTLNGAGHYGFMLTAIDGQRPGGGGVDRFRIKTWDKDSGDAIAYDNQMGSSDDASPTTALGGGSIVIHDGQ